MSDSLSNIWLSVTTEEPITGQNSTEHCFLKTSEFTNSPRINQFATGVVTFNDLYENIDAPREPLIKVI